MSFEWTSQPLSIQSITTQFTLPVIIRSAPGFRGSNQPILLHSVKHIPFAYGRALKVSDSNSNHYGSYKPMDSETVAVPLAYPGYFECLPSRHIKQPVGVTTEKSIPRIVERMESEQRSQAFYIGAPLKVYTIENGSNGTSYRSWHQLEAHQMILFDKLIHVEYAPTENDQLTDDDFTYSWFFCFGKQILNRHEHVVKCVLAQQIVCYIPCTSRDEVNLIPVGQHGSSNPNKLQNILNLIEQFQLPINVKLVLLPGSYAYRDFPGQVQLLGSRAEEFAVCASLSTNNIAVIPISTPLKFVVAQIPSSATQMQHILSTCHIFKHSFDMQIRRILISSDSSSSAYRSRSRYPKIQEAIDHQIRSHKRSYTDRKSMDEDEQTNSTATDEGYRTSSGASQRRYPRAQRSVSVEGENFAPNLSRKRAPSTDEESIYSTLAHGNNKKKDALNTTISPPPLPKKPPNFPYPSRQSSTSTVNSEQSSNIIDSLDLPNAEGAILMDASNELFLALPSASRFT